MLSGSSPALCKRLMKASIWGVQPVGAADGMVVSGGGGGACDLRDAWGDLVKSEGYCSWCRGTRMRKTISVRTVVEVRDEVGIAG